MRWFESLNGDIRTREGFLFFPKGGIQKRWLENAKWVEKYNGVIWEFLRWEDE